MHVRPLAAVALLALTALGVTACGASQAPAAAEGQRCKQDRDCQSGLVCKAAQCGPLRSRPGRPCVTAEGCEAGLQCLSGRCSAGPASEPMCRGACRQMQDTFQREALDALRHVDDDGGAPTPEEQALIDELTGDDFGERCMSQCLQLTREQALCLQQIRSIAEIQLCQ